MMRSKFLADRFFVGLFFVLMAFKRLRFSITERNSLCHRSHSEFAREANDKIAGG